MGIKTFFEDSTGRMFDDELTHFLVWYLYDQNRPKDILVPFDDGQYFIEGVSGITLLRQAQFQVQLFLAQPNIIIPSHIHPNVDSYEVFLRGMTFTHNGEKVVDFNDVVQREDGMSDILGSTIRVLPSDWHGGVSSPDGGAFLSVQHWLNGLKPTSVANDWHGDTMGDQHLHQITTGKDNK